MSTHPTTRDLLDFIAASPTPYHCVAEAMRRLTQAGFRSIDARDRWDLESGESYFVQRGGALVAWRMGSEPAAEAGFRLIGAHTDSPNLRLKPRADVRSHGYAQLGVEVYGGALTYTWLDRDLGLAGRVVVEGSAKDGAGSAAGIETRLLRIDRPLLRVPSLAIHLNRNVRKEGLKLNDQKHLVPILDLAADEGGDADTDATSPGLLRTLLAGELDIEPERILSWDLALMDLAPPVVGGASDSMIFAPRLDNQAMCHAALTALLRTDSQQATQLVCLYDHEEVGSSSTAGAGGPLVEELLRRITELEVTKSFAGAMGRAMARSYQISADMAHAVHPNYADRHEPEHLPRLGGGPVIKVNAQQRYATDAETAGLFEALCRSADVPCQTFVSRTDLPCGSTIGPISATRLGVRTVDVGNAMLSMHSIREQAGAEDPERMVQVMQRFLALPP